MGRRGPAPAPAGVKLARGETRPSRVNYDAPVPRQREPTMPRGMTSVAQSVWRRVIKEMAGTGVILAADHDILRTYCEAVASYLRSQALWQGSLPLVPGARGRELVPNPIWRIVREDREAIRLLARELGLSPSARAGLHIDMGAESGDLDAFLGPTPRALRLVAPDED